jgi:septum formation protein
MRIVLASSSPRRRELLARLGVDFTMAPSTVVERDPFPGEDPAAYALFLAEQKADDVAYRFPDAVVLGADTVVAVDGMILNKPADEADALRMLRLLRGRSHVVVTGVAVRGPTARSAAITARVWMRDSCDEDLRGYIATGEPMDKAGAYAVQGLGGRLVERVEGCYETVVGLPLCTAAALLSAAGASVPTEPTCRHLPPSLESGI